MMSGMTRSHTISMDAIPAYWAPRFRGIDFGFTCESLRVSCKRPILMDDCTCTESFTEVGRLVSDWAEDIKKHAAGRAGIDAILSLIGMLKAEQCWKSMANAGHAQQQRVVLAGIEAVQKPIFDWPETGLPCSFNRGSGCTVNRDARLIEEKKPASTAEEIGSYVWALMLHKSRLEKRGSCRLINDHGMDKTTCKQQKLMD